MRWWRFYGGKLGNDVDDKDDVVRLEESNVLEYVGCASFVNRVSLMM